MYWGEQRPNVDKHDQHASFPSGHSMTGNMPAALQSSFDNMAHIEMLRLIETQQRILQGIQYFNRVIAVLTAGSRIITGDHTPGNVVYGLFLAETFSTTVANATYLALNHRQLRANTELVKRDTKVIQRQMLQEFMLCMSMVFASPALPAISLFILLVTARVSLRYLENKWLYKEESPLKQAVKDSLFLPFIYKFNDHKLACSLALLTLTGGIGINLAMLQLTFAYGFYQNYIVNSIGFGTGKLFQPSDFEKHFNACLDADGHQRQMCYSIIGGISDALRYFSFASMATQALAKIYVIKKAASAPSILEAGLLANGEHKQPVIPEPMEPAAVAPQT